MVTGFGPQPAGVPMPPISAPQAQEIMSARPKLLSIFFNSASSRIPTPMGIRIAATAMSLIHMEAAAPTVRKARMIILGLWPIRARRRVVKRRRSPVLPMAVEKIMTPMQNNTIS